MKLPYSWLKDFTDVGIHNVPAKQYAADMTMAGTMVGSWESPADEISNVVVGKIVSMERHPNSDHMWVCQIDIGKDKPVQIVTGAWNVHVGDLVPAALHKSTLPGGIKIEKGKLRGVPSNGMLCSLKELQLEERDFPYGVITAAALLNDYKPLDPEKPSIPADIQPGHKVFGPVVAAKVLACATQSYGIYHTCLDLGDKTACPDTNCQNLHEGDMVAYNTKTDTVCTLADLRAQQAEFPHCINDGIFILNEDCKPGDDIAPVLSLDEITFDFDILHNRPDCLSIIGLARESAATFDKKFSLPKPQVKNTVGNIADHLSVEIRDADLCPRYSAAMAKNIQIKPSPRWMRDRLRAAGIRPINNIVDITNYVMLEYGPPMHAFDYRCLKDGKIIVRRCTANEECTTLDGQTRKLWENTLVIADAEKAVAIAGVMGGENSEITEQTEMIVFESAMFDSVSVRTTSRRLGMRTEASGRFERGVNCEGCMTALERACQLVEELGAGEIIGGYVDAYPNPKPVRTLKLEPERVSAYIGAEIDREFMVKTLEKLAFKVDGDQVTVPSWRDDMEGMADIAEEVARYFGYDNIPTTLLRGETTKGGLTRRQVFNRKVNDACNAAGYSEAKTLSFLSPKAFDKSCLAENDVRRQAVVITNPLGEDQSLLRTTALPAMLEAAARNYNYRSPSIHLFEPSKIYLPKLDENGKTDPHQLPDEKSVLVMATYGDDFFHLKGCIEGILTMLSISGCVFTPCNDNPCYHSGRCASVMYGDKLVGYAGQTHPAVLKNYGIGTELYMAELDMDLLFDLVDQERYYQPIPKYPASTRDLAVLCDENIYVLQLETCIKKAAKKALEKLELFDVYRGAQVAAGKKSVAFSLSLRAADHTLTDKEADEVIQNILKALEAEYGATLRA